MIRNVRSNKFMYFYLLFIIFNLNFFIACAKNKNSEQNDLASKAIKQKASGLFSELAVDQVLQYRKSVIMPLSGAEKVEAEKILINLESKKKNFNKIQIEKFGSALHIYLVSREKEGKDAELEASRALILELKSILRKIDSGS